MSLLFNESEFDNELIHYLNTHSHKYKTIKRTQTHLMFTTIYAFYEVITPDNQKYKYQVSKDLKNRFKIVTLL
jgi:hypothetical protein